MAVHSDPSSCNTINSGETLQLVIGLVIAGVSVTYAAWNLATSNSLFGGPAVPVDEEMGRSLHEAGPPVATPVGGSTAASSAQPAGTASGTAGGEGAAAGLGEQSEKKIKEVDELDQDRDLSQNASKFSKFHFVMAAAAMYMAMILTSWSDFKVGTEEPYQTYDLGPESMWIKIVSQWLTQLLYIWTIVAPHVLKNRSFA